MGPAQAHPLQGGFSDHSTQWKHISYFVSCSVLYHSQSYSNKISLQRSEIYSSWDLCYPLLYPLLTDRSASLYVLSDPSGLCLLFSPPSFPPFPSRHVFRSQNKGLHACRGDLRHSWPPAFPRQALRVVWNTLQGSRPHPFSPQAVLGQCSITRALVPFCLQPSSMPTTPNSSRSPLASESSSPRVRS